MNFLLSEQQEQLFETIERYTKKVNDAGIRRRAFDGETDFDIEFWRGLMELGAGAIMIPAQYDGVELELFDLALVVEVLGAAAAPGPFLGHVLAAHAITIAGTEAQKAAWLPKLGTGEIIGAVALPGHDPKEWTIEIDDGRLSGTVRDVPGAHVADLIVVGLAGGGLALVEKGSGLSFTLLDVADRTRRGADLSFDQAPAALLPGGAGHAQSVIDAALILLSADAFGGARSCLAMAAEYARTREQFGRPIGSFQGLKFQLADMAIEIEPARGLYWYAAYAYDHVLAERTRMAAIAKAHLGDVFMQAARDTIEAHGGIGYTWEYDAQIYFKRAMFDYAWLGTPALHRDRQAQLAGW